MKSYQPSPSKRATPIVAFFVVLGVLLLLLLIVGARIVRAPEPEETTRGASLRTPSASTPAAGAGHASSAHSATATSQPTRAYRGAYSGTPTPNPILPDRPDPLASQYYEVQTGDTLSGIAYAFGCTVDELAAANGVAPDAIWPGQRLLIPVAASQSGPDLKLVPDSEMVYGPAYIHFDPAAFIQEQGGYLADYSEEIAGSSYTGVEIVQLVAEQYSVGPRVLLALLEFQAGWVTQSEPAEDTLYYPMGSYEEHREGLYFQLSWAAAELNSGYYGWKYGDWITVRLADGSRAAIAPGLNAGTVGVQNYLGQVHAGEAWQAAAGPGGFAATYERLFGNPFAYCVEPLIPPGLVQPELRLPWEAHQTWYLTGGPHAGWGRGSGWAALDFAPRGELGCQPASAWATAAAPGLVLRSEDGVVVIDLDGDGYEQSGWVLVYLHVYNEGRVEDGVWLETGDRIGRPSCEGGFAAATHLHFARRYNGEWLPAGRDPVPLVLSGWTAVEAESEYDGTMVKGSLVREACECTMPTLNGLVSDNTSPD